MVGSERISQAQLKPAASQFDSKSASGELSLAHEDGTFSKGRSGKCKYIQVNPCRSCEEDGKKNQKKTKNYRLQLRRLSGSNAPVRPDERYAFRGCSTSSA